jgi:hypothetical protein
MHRVGTENVHNDSVHFTVHQVNDTEGDIFNEFVSVYDGKAAES